MPSTKPEHHWELLLDTAEDVGDVSVPLEKEEYPLQGRSVVVLCTRLPQDTGQALSGVQAEAIRKKAQRAPTPDMQHAVLAPS